MARRLELQQKMEDILGSRNVYYQPPANVQMKYPAIVYSRDYDSAQHGDNRAYRRTKRWQITLIDQNPDSPTNQLIEELPMCSFSRHYSSDNLNHDVYDLYF